MSTPIENRNRNLFERCKKLGDHAYAEDVGLVLRPNIAVTLKDRWGFDVVQSSAWYAVSLARWCTDHPDACDEEQHRLNRLMTTMSGRQDRDPDSATYGNIYWRVGWPEVRDRNGVSFWSPEAGLIFLRYRDLLTDDTASRVEQTLHLCVNGLDLHRPRWQYTNIFLLNILSRLTLAKALDRTDVLTRAEEDWHTWYTETGKGGFTEYNSPTYIVTALVPLGRMLDFARPEMCDEVERALVCLYADFCWHYHRPSGGLAGAMSRAYSGDWLHNSMTNHIAYQQLGEPHTAINLSGPFTAASNYLAPEHIRSAGTRDKTGLVVRAAIPNLDIQRHTVFGEHFALGTKSGPAYGHQELPLTIAHPGTRQHLIYLHQESQVRSSSFTASEGSTSLVLLDIPESDPESAPPHAWSKLRLGPESEFKTIQYGADIWDGDYLDVASGDALSLSTDKIAMSFSFSIFPEEGASGETAKILFWNDYQTDQLTVEMVAWKPTRVGIALTVVDGSECPVIGRVMEDENDRYTLKTGNGRIEVSVGRTVEESVPLLEAPGFTWHRDWRFESVV